MELHAFAALFLSAISFFLPYFRLNLNFALDRKSLHPIVYLE